MTAFSPTEPLPKTGRQITALEIGKLGEHILRAVNAGKAFEHRLSWITQPPDAPFPIANLRIDSDGCKQRVCGRGDMIRHDRSKSSESAHTSRPIRRSTKTDSRLSAGSVHRLLVRFFRRALAEEKMTFTSPNLNGAPWCASERASQIDPV
jgi:hypothetical protein